ncbi:hypothetical protein C0J52_19368, partial [Blattella germanica]
QISDITRLFVRHYIILNVFTLTDIKLFCVQASVMAERHLAEIRTFLANSSLQATPDWVQGCVEFFISEHQNEEFTSNELQEFVFDQWKLADLREMGQGCLPPNINNAIKINLPDKYVLQVEWIKDVGRPAYTQLQNIRKQKNENADIGSDAPQPWEPRPTRMLQLMMCDGKQSVKGIEYKSINSLTENLLPGFKVKDKNQIHNLEMNPNPVQYRIQTDLQIDSQVQVQRPQTSDNNYENMQLVAGQTSGQTAQTRNGPMQNPRQTTQRNPEEDFLEEDDLLIDTEMDAHLSMLEHQFEEELRPAHNNQNEYLDAMEQRYLDEIQAMAIEEMDSSIKQPVTKNIPVQDNVSSLLLDEDDDFLCQMQFEELENKTKEPNMQKNHVIEYRLNFKQPNQNQTSLPSSHSSSSSKNKTKFVKTQAHNINNQSKITSFLNRSNETNDSGINSLPSVSTTCSSVSEGKPLKQTDVESEKKQQFLEGILNSRFSNDLPSQIKRNDIHIPPTSSVQSIEKTSFLENSIKSSARKSIVKVPIITNQNPFVYLSQIKTPVECRKVYTVKAFVITLLCQITFGKDGWQLRVRLCDGSSSLDVRLSSEVSMVLKASFMS